MCKIKKLKFVFLFTLLLFALFLSVSFAMESTADEGASLEAISDEKRAYNFLLLGVDSVSASSDVIILVRADVENKSATVLQLPRDTYTKEYGKLNSLFAASYNSSRKKGFTKEASRERAAKALAKFLKKSLSIEIDGSFVVTLDDFRDIIDSIGGVDVTLDRSLDYDDPSQDLHIHLNSGENHLDGRAAEGLCRMRSAYLTADYGRMDAQKLFLTAFIKKARYELSAGELILFITKAYGKVVTDVPISTLIDIGSSASTFDLSSVRLASVKGFSVKTSFGLSEVIPKKTLLEAAELFAAPSPESALESADFTNSENQEIEKYYNSEPISSLVGVTADEIDKNGIEIK